MSDSSPQPVSSFTQANSVADGDFFIVLPTTGANNDLMKVTKATLLDFSANTPANSSVGTSGEHKLFFDASYIYVSYSNGTIKRAALSSF